MATLRRQKSSTALSIGLVEVGSSAVRFAVAVSFSDGTLLIQNKGNYPHAVNPGKLDLVELSALWRAVYGFQKALTEFNCDRKLIYGTDICRQLAILDKQYIPGYIHVLSPEDEAMASWAAGVFSDHAGARVGNYTIVDQGAGSTEITTANWTGLAISNRVFNGLGSGHRQFSSLFETSSFSYVREINNFVESNHENFLSHRHTANGKLCVLGSAATKIAWIKIRKSIDDAYKASLVDSVDITAKEIFDIHARVTAIFKRDPKQARYYIDPRLNTPDETARVLSGSVFFIMVCKKLGFSSLRVSGYGTRHGIAFLIHKGLF